MAEQVPSPRGRWCTVKGWPIGREYARCPYCGLAIESKLHPDDDTAELIRDLYDVEWPF